MSNCDALPIGFDNNDQDHDQLYAESEQTYLEINFDIFIQDMNETSVEHPSLLSNNFVYDRVYNEFIDLVDFMKPTELIDENLRDTTCHISDEMSNEQIADAGRHKNRVTLVKNAGPGHGASRK